jgi:signal peptidase I
MTTLDNKSLLKNTKENDNIKNFGKGKPAGFASEFSEVYSFFKTLVVFLLLAFMLRASVVEAFKIPSESMKPTLQKGDHILVSKFSYGFRLPFMREVLFSYAKPKRGDVVVFTRPDEPGTLEDESAINIIKRVVALEGERVAVHDRKVYINGVPVEEDFARWEENGIPEGEYPEDTVPPGHVFLMGDNRDHSKDSRFWSYHYLDTKLIKGRALIIYWSWYSLSRMGQIIR